MEKCYAVKNAECKVKIFRKINPMNLAHYYRSSAIKKNTFLMEWKGSLIKLGDNTPSK